MYLDDDILYKLLFHFHLLEQSLACGLVCSKVDIGVEHMIIRSTKDYSMLLVCSMFFICKLTARVEQSIAYYKVYSILFLPGLINLSMCRTNSHPFSSLSYGFLFVSRLQK